jgi:hypothetical protein
MAKIRLRQTRVWKGFQWREEYQDCGCHNIQTSRRDLPGCCPTHGSTAREPLKFYTDNPLETGCKNAIVSL